MDADEAKMPNGEPFYMNFMGSRDNRFSSMADRSKNRPQLLKKTLHAFNLPAGISEDAVMKLFEESGCVTPTQIAFVESRYKGCQIINCVLNKRQ